ncbi:DUF3078 domain-containing protein [Aquimarina sp. 2201CG5-10]|uniref:DUF3078 domain-containing protein n=1 Tax=Aquimarina callyspongiae TaxID=3098150 RepID=UPI002AB36C1E|nr:DUF3078 domain-containing protein [Aquimarina sp. 2201CG5-10]MDY8135291.1 DUF3078 domain-containing protein [Aquimarina sp. 2201CG5-10]
MKKTFLTLVLLASTTILCAQEDAKDETPKDGWTKTGNISFLFNQSAFNAEWLGGGTSNIAGNLSLSYDFNYRKGKMTWDNKILADYGLTKLKDQEFTRKTNDRFEFNSLLGRQIKETNWYYSFFLNFKTQFAPGYVFGEDALGNEIRTETTHIFSPAYLQAGPGFLWKKSDNLKVNIAPATARLIFVDGDFTDVGNDQVAIDAFNAAGGYFGVEANESTRFEFGAAVNAYAKFEIMKNVSMENILNLYSNYLEDPQNVDIDYTANVIMTINKYLSANIAFQAIYDDNAIGAFQIREVFGLGVNYGF